MNSPSAISDVPVSRHLPALDGVRALAFVSVMVYHAFEVWKQPDLGPAWNAVQSVARAGWLGVDLFFVLSGFLITGILLASREKEGGLRRFYLRRSLRVFPLYFAYLGVAFGYLVWSTHDWGQLVTWEHLSYWLYLQNWVIALQSYDAFKPLAHLWSLAIEEQFYLAWPFLVMWLPRRYLLPAVTAILLLAFFSRTAVIAYGTFPVLSYVSTPTRMDTLAAGSALAILMLSPAARDWWAAYAKHMALLGALLIVCIAGLRHGYEIVDPVVRVVGFGANIVFCLGLVAWAALGETALSVEWLRADALRWIGSRSYAGYLFHWPITLWVSSVLHQQGMAPLPGILLTLSLVSVLTMLAAQLSWRVIERPALSFKERWAP